MGKLFVQLSCFICEILSEHNNHELSEHNNHKLSEHNNHKLFEHDNHKTLILLSRDMFINENRALEFEDASMKHSCQFTHE